MKLEYHGQEVQIDPADWPRVKQHFWHPSRDGMRTRINSKIVLLHRFIMDAKPNEIVIFNDGNKWNCRKLNLVRLAKTGIPSTKSKISKYRGVTINHSGKFVARFCGQYLGIHASEEAAAKAYDEAHYQKFKTRVNFPC